MGVKEYGNQSITLYFTHSRDSDHHPNQHPVKTDEKEKATLALHFPKRNQNLNLLETYSYMKMSSFVRNKKKVRGTLLYIITNIKLIKAIFPKATLPSYII